MPSLLHKALTTLRHDGVGVFLKKSVAYTKRHLDALKGEQLYVDILFVNGCNLPHPQRYRVQHQRLQMMAFGLSSAEVWYEDLTSDMLRYCRGVLFYRCPFTPVVEQVIGLARYFNKAVLFDIDDLVIDTKYTDLIPYVRQMPAAEKAGYDAGVKGYHDTMVHAEAVITTTEGLARELGHYMSEVFINRNTASETMVRLSEAAWAAWQGRKDKGQVILGYFSGSITHNDDFAMILPVICRLLERYAQLRLMIVGELDLPAALVPYRSRIIVKPFVDWQKLPDLIAQADINLVPLLDNVFNEAKSENKWVEAALVRVPTVASDIGAFRRMMADGETGLLCRTEADWETALISLIESPERRDALARAAYEDVSARCLLITTGKPLCDFIRRHLRPNAAMFFPSFDISGGVLVALRHADILRRHGYDVTAINLDTRPKAPEDILSDGFQTMALRNRKSLRVETRFDLGIATMWFTVDAFLQWQVQEKLYLVQNFETGFYEIDTVLRLMANSTYCRPDIRYVTISRWCQRWLKDSFGQTARYAPNGLERERFAPAERDWSGKIRVLIEGDSESEYKNVDESFRIAALLPPARYEIWYVSYNGKARDWYRVDEFRHKVPYAEMPDIYRQCHILLKTSILESFSYPPLEMMATGGAVVVRENEGNREYLRDGENCLFYDPADLDTAVQAIESIVRDGELRQTLLAGGLRTADERDWPRCEAAVLSLYEKE
ncbi:MAG: glycosyltransferase [Schwartzia sp.]|nr:glycosyltransferase [Schwartzia sp. (in: firmicutes)]